MLFLLLLHRSGWSHEHPVKEPNASVQLGHASGQLTVIFLGSKHSQAGWAALGMWSQLLVEL
jgi:hypothetical protein